MEIKFRSNWTFNHQTEEEAHTFYNFLRNQINDYEMQDYRVFPLDHPLRDDKRYKSLVNQLKAIKNEIKELENG